MTATILDAIQDIATPAMIKAATSALGVSDSHATSGLAAAATSILGGLVQKSGDAGLMAKVAGLVGATTPDSNMFANMSSMLAGGVPASPIQALGNKLLGLIFGDRTAAMIAAVASATGLTTKAASGLATLAAPMVLAALRNKLGAAPAAASLVSMLAADKGVIAGAMPAPLRTLYGLANLAPVAAAAAAVAPVAAAVVAAAAPSVAATLAPAAAPKPTSPSAHSASGYASATVTTAAPAPKPAAPAAAPAPVVAAPAPVVHAAPAAKPVAPVAPAVQAAPAAAAAPAVQAHAQASSHAAKPAAPATASYQSAQAGAEGDDFLAAKLGMLAGGALLTGLIWYWAYGRAPMPVAPAPKPVAAAPAAPAPKPAPAPVAAAPAPAPAAAPAAPVSTQLVPVPGANGLMKYTLPGGATIEVAKDGLESKMLTFINTKDAAIDNKLWFDFDRLSFVTASSDLTPESKAQVAAAVAILKAYPAVSIKVGGYTDNQGNADANLKLSDDRANRVMSEMVAGGVAADRIEAKGYGEEHAIGDNATPEGRAKNRRTSLSIRTK